MLASGSAPDSYEFLTDPGAMLGLEADWRRLSTVSADRDVHRSHAWYLNSWKNVSAPRNRKLLCLVARRDGRVGLIWPFVIYRNAIRSIARPLGPEASDYSTVLVEESEDAQLRVAAAWRRFREVCKCDLLHLPQVPTDTLLGKVLSGNRGPRYHYDHPLRGISWQGVGSWDSYLAAVSGGNLLRDMKRCRHRLDGLGEVDIQEVADADQRKMAIDWMLSRKRDWLSATGRQNGWILTPEYRQFLHAMAGDRCSSPQYLCLVMMLDGQIIAAMMGWLNETRFEVLMQAFDPAYNRCSPGKLLTEHYVHWAYERGIGLDFRLGDDPWKGPWSNRVGTATSYFVANSAWGAAFVLGLKAKSQIARRIPEKSRDQLKALWQTPLRAIRSPAGKHRAY